MIKVFVDANIFLDLFLDRGSFAEPAFKLLNWCELGLIDGYTTSFNIANLYYILRNQLSKTAAIDLLRKLLNHINILGTSKGDILSAFDNDFSDIEDGFQYYTVLGCGEINFIITRNKKDYKNSLIPVLLPEEFIKKHS